MKKLLDMLKKHRNKLIPAATCVVGAAAGQPGL